MRQTIIILGVLLAINKGLLAQHMMKVDKSEWFNTLSAIKGTNQSVFPMDLAGSMSQYETVLMIGSQFKEIPPLLEAAQVFKMMAMVDLKKLSDGTLVYDKSRITFVNRENKRYEDDTLKKKIIQLFSSIRYDVFVREGYQLNVPYQYAFSLRKMK